MDCIRKKTKKVKPITKKPYFEARSFCWYWFTGITKSTPKAYWLKSGRLPKVCCENALLMCIIFQLATNPVALICLVLSSGRKFPVKLGEAQLDSIFTCVVFPIGTIFICWLPLYETSKF